MKRLASILIALATLLLFHGFASSQQLTDSVSQSSNIWTALIAILAAFATAAVTGLCTWMMTRSSLATELKLLKKDSDQCAANLQLLEKEKKILVDKSKLAEKEITKLKISADRLNTIRTKLKSSSLVRTYRQPVILVGPRLVGKTSLLKQWHAPWDTSRLLNRTQRHYTSDVPVYDFTEEDREPHFADPEIMVPVHNHLVLKVHDFPGELDAQESVCKAIITETENLQNETGKNLGIVLICMFDAEEAASGLSHVTRQYYNGELFKQLRSLIIHHQADIERLILVFNKYDALKALKPSVPDRDLLKLCVNKFDPAYDLLHNICNPGKVCEVFTMLSRQEMHTKNRGAPIVLGEASRAFVRALAGEQAEHRLIEQSATTYASEKFFP